MKSKKSQLALLMAMFVVLFAWAMAIRAIKRSGQAKPGPMDYEVPSASVPKLRNTHLGLAFGERCACANEGEAVEVVQNGVMASGVCFDGVVVTPQTYVVNYYTHTYVVCPDPRKDADKGSGSGSGKSDAAGIRVTDAGTAAFCHEGEACSLYGLGECDTCSYTVDRRTKYFRCEQDIMVVPGNYNACEYVGVH